MSAEVFLCRWIWSADERWIEGGALEVRAGRIQRVLESRAAIARARRTAARCTDFGDAALTPGWVNAHAHLELTNLAGAIERGSTFGAWVARLIALRNASGPRDLESAARRGADRALATGTTTIGDIDSTGASERALAGHALRHVLFREVLDAQDAARTPFASKRIARALPRRARRLEGISPHAPFSVSPQLFAIVGRIARARRTPISMHWSETRAELEWLLEGRGPLAPLLGRSPLASGLDLFERAGLLRRGSSLVHGNFPSSGEPERVAASGAVLIHCPGSHAWFGREPFPLARYRRAGVAIALGTDSLASNDDLDLGREAALFAAAHPALAPLEVVRAATTNGARALGLDGSVGELAPGANADWVLRDAGRSSAGHRLEAWIHGELPVRGVWISGRRVKSAV